MTAADLEEEERRRAAVFAAAEAALRRLDPAAMVTRVGLSVEAGVTFRGLAAGRLRVTLWGDGGRFDAAHVGGRGGWRARTDAAGVLAPDKADGFARTLDRRHAAAETARARRAADLIDRAAAEATLAAAFPGAAFRDVDYLVRRMRVDAGPGAGKAVIDTQAGGAVRLAFSLAPDEAPLAAAVVALLRERRTAAHINRMNSIPKSHTGE
jgi:hypothetical protein